jgi:hypothetical protein
VQEIAQVTEAVNGHDAVLSCFSPGGHNVREHGDEVLGELLESRQMILGIPIRCIESGRTTGMRTAARHRNAIAREAGDQLIDDLAYVRVHRGACDRVKILFAAFVQPRVVRRVHADVRGREEVALTLPRLMYMVIM